MPRYGYIILIGSALLLGMLLWILYQNTNVVTPIVPVVVNTPLVAPINTSLVELTNTPPIVVISTPPVETPASVPPVVNKPVVVITKPVTPVKNDPVVPPVVNLPAVETMAWIYPGAPTCGINFKTLSVKKIDILKAEYFKVDENGALVFLTEKTSGCNGYSLGNINILKANSTEQYVTIASSEATGMRLFLVASNANTTTIEKLVTFVNENKLTGVEIDFEDFGGWNAVDYSNYKTFVTSLGTALHANGKKLMVDGPATTNIVEQAWYKWRYADFVSLPVDKMVVMTYDYQFDQGAGEPVAPLPWIKDVIKWTVQSFPDKNRLSFGIPSYGYKSLFGTGKYKLLTYDQMKTEPGFGTATRNSISGEMSWQNNGTIYFYQDATSMNKKLEAVASLGIKSVSVWHLGGNPWFSN